MVYVDNDWFDPCEGVPSGCIDDEHWGKILIDRAFNFLSLRDDRDN